MIRSADSEQPATIKREASRDGNARLSVVILTQNVEELVGECLESVTWADEIVVIDGGSHDRTLAICRRYTDRIIERPWPGVSTLQWIYGIEQARGPWVLMLASDVRVPPQAQTELRKAVASEEYRGYHTPLKNYFLGRWIQHCGWWPDYQLLLFRKDSAWVEPREHGLVHVRGPVGTLGTAFIHYAHRSVSEYIRKTNRYTDAEVRSWNLTEQPFKPRFVITKPWRNFKKTYWRRQGYRDGMHGLVFCGLMAFYKFLLYAKVWEHQQRAAGMLPASSWSLSSVLDEQERETDAGAHALLQRQGLTSLTVSGMGRQIITGFLTAFWRIYLGEGKFRAGTFGLIQSALAGWTRFFTWAKYWELCERRWPGVAQSAVDVTG